MFYSFGYEFSSTLQLIFKVSQKWLSRLKRSISPFLEVSFEKFFDNHM